MEGKLIETPFPYLKKIKNISNEATTKVAYHALFEPHMRYGLIVCLLFCFLFFFWGGGDVKRIPQPDPTTVKKRHKANVRVRP